MKSFLIIPMGGKGQRFIDAGYKTYKPFLPLDSQNKIFDNIIKNFSKLHTELIILANLKYLQKKNIEYLKKKKCKLIDIPNHKKGPLYSIQLGLDQINNIVKDNKNIFICYSDINWFWDFNKIQKKISHINSAIFTHSGFHPHLQVNSISDFCLAKRDIISKISEKKTFGKDYQKELLAIGCYYFKTLDLLNNFFDKNKLRVKKEYYLTSLIQFLLKQKVKIKSININKFVHLGSPEQYEDFIKWKNYNLNLKKNSYKKLSKSTIMLMGGRGQRLSNITKSKPFLTVNNKPIFKNVFDRLNSSEKMIITNKNFQKKLKNKNFYLFITEQTNSMFETIYLSKKYLTKKFNYFLTSCDCFGVFNSNHLKNFLVKNKKDLVYFAFNFSYFQKSLGNSHSIIHRDNKNNIKIKVKSPFNGTGYGHAGYFWIKNPKVFEFLNYFKKSKIYKNIKREVLLDDYLKFLVDKKLISSNYYLLDDYIHIGSEKEYREHCYWNNYFNEK